MDKGEGIKGTRIKVQGARDKEGGKRNQEAGARNKNKSRLAFRVAR